MTEQEERETILKVAKEVRKGILKESSTATTLGWCYEASLDLIRSLKKRKIYIKLMDGIFKVDYTQWGAPSNNEHSEDESHYWCEWKHLPVDVTADQFNEQLKVCNRVKAIVFGTNLDRYLTWDG